ncbi:DUF6571 family protein [Streptomyces reniochalinae]|uniref:Uncharacterized protein n=1 Tax=Streptomyces reniochalinae TaxID=2250578 RepID=A0A367E5D3_9ACTN|nr:DUF6571 family protein [Streptomyces reniochalinae]RCG13258.1 hypothetical protein DQ392_33690 [Streptomyces reniochalinae]
MGNDLREAEDPGKGGDEDVWDLHGGFSGKNRGWFANDPMDSVLGIMSQQPDTATEFLDPGADKKNDMLHYLVKDRDWELVDKNEFHGKASVVVGTEDKDSRTGLGLVIEAASTGQEPGAHYELGTHNPAQARVMYHTIDELNGAQQAEQMPENLREPMARALRDYVPDLHEILGKNNNLYNTQEGAWQDDEGLTRMSVFKDDLVPVLRGIGDDPKALGLLYQAQQQYGQDQLSALPDNAGAATRVAIKDTAAALGAYDGVRADIIFDERFKKQTWANDFNTAATTVPGYALQFTGAYTPAADAANRLVGVFSYEVTKDRLAEATLEATKENAEQFTAGQREVDNMVAMWAQSNGHDQDSTFTKDLIGTGQTKHEEGRDGALRRLRPDY